jgi:hypothetical protein
MLLGGGISRVEREQSQQSGGKCSAGEFHRLSPV